MTLVEFLANVVPVEDEDVSKQLQKSFAKQGIEVMVSSEVTKVDTSGKGCKVTVKNATGEKVMALMFDLNREQGTTLVLVTHDPAIAALCQRRLTVEAGRILQDGAMAEFS